jgi:hypothetical protein
MRIMAALLILMIASPSEASAVHWPWEPHYRVHRRHQGTEPAVEPPNCDRINESIKVLDPKNLERALRESTPKQRETIDNCARAAPP